MTTKTDHAANSPIAEGTTHHDFGIVDSKGRKLGCLVELDTTVLVDAPDARSYYPRPAGTYYRWFGQATRNGVSYGACQRWNFCATEAERTAAVEAYVAAAAKRQQKNAA